MNTSNFFEYAGRYYQSRYDAEEIAWHTFYGAQSGLRSFKTFCMESGKGENLSFDEIDTHFLQDYKAWCLAKGNSAETVNRKLSPIISCIRRASREGAECSVLSWRPEELYFHDHCHRYGPEAGRLACGTRERIRYLSDDQMRQLINYYRSSPCPAQERSIELFLFSFHACGMRISDILTLEWKHVNYDNATITKVLVKSKSPITIPLSSPAVEILLRHRTLDGNARFVFNKLPEDIDLSDDETLSRTIDSCERTIRHHLNTAGRNLGFPFPLSMHAARHTFAVKALNSAGADVHLISRLMGHSSVTVTERVYAKFLLPTLSTRVREVLTFQEYSV